MTTTNSVAGSGQTGAQPAPAEIARLHAAYAFTLDHQQHQAFAALFADDGVLYIADGDGISGGAELAAFSAGSPRGVHVAGPVFPDDDGLAHTPWTFSNAATGAVLSGYYRDRFTRDPGGELRFASRHVSIVARTASA